MRSLHAVSVLGGLVLLLGACESHPAELPDPSWLTASVEGNVAASYQGSGAFITTPDGRRPAAPALFLLASQGHGESRNQGMELMRQGSEPPGVGRHALGPASGDPTRVQAGYLVVRNGVMERYAATEGELEITTSTGTTLEGSFRFRAVLHATCSGSLSAARCTVNPNPGPDAPTVQVSGSFSAGRGRLPH